MSDDSDVSVLADIPARFDLVEKINVQKRGRTAMVVCEPTVPAGCTKSDLRCITETALASINSKLVLGGRPGLGNAPMTRRELLMAP
jgi:hypothetical protein